LAYQVVVVGSGNRQLEDLLRSSGMRSSTLPAAELSRLAQAGLSTADALLLDLRDQTALPRGLMEVKRQHPSTGVVIVASKLDPALMLEAMRAGVNEVVTEPLNQADLEAAILRVVTQKVTSIPGEVFVVVGGKGGVGSTTVAVNLATVLARLDPGSTLLVDLHQTHGDAAVFLGAEPRFSVVDALENTHRLDEAFLRDLVLRTKAGPHLLASSDRPTVAPADARRVRLLLDFASRQYRHLVLDVPRSDSALLDGLESATKFVLVVNQELATVRGSARMASLLRQRYGRDKLVPVLTRYDTAAAIGLEDVERVLGEPIRHVLPSNYRVALEALNKGRPLTLDNHNKLASAFQAFAKDLAGARSKAAARPAEAGQGLFGKLIGRRV
jgi:pilus assembly protein CpaE